MIENIIDVCYGSDLYEAGRGDDGVPYLAEMYYVVVECKNGERFCHTAIFRGCKVNIYHIEGEEFHSFEDVREQAKTDAQRLVDRVQAALQAGRALDPQYWVAIDPCYGSDAYIENGIEAERIALERREG